MEFRFLTISDTNVSAAFDTISEAKLALKECRLLKKQLALQQRELVQEQRAIRAEYTNAVRTQGSKFRGRGLVASLARDYQQATRDARREELAITLAPLEQTKNALDALKNATDNLMLQIERTIMDNR